MTPEFDFKSSFDFWLTKVIETCSKYTFKLKCQRRVLDHFIFARNDLIMILRFQGHGSHPSKSFYELLLSPGIKDFRLKFLVNVIEENVCKTHI